MNILEKRMLESLKNLKQHNITGVKISFEDEGLTGELAQIITSVSMRADVPVAIKIGGAEARRDIHDAMVLGADKVVAPMIETPYSLKKFVEAKNSVYHADEEHDTKFIINIETVTGYKNLFEMMHQEEANQIDGITLGRVDFAGSLGKDRKFCNSPEMLKIAQQIAEIARSYNKKFCIGGAISGDAVDFMRALPQDVFHSFETRNIIFDAKSALADNDINGALTDAMGFELAWMQRKREFYGKISNAEAARIDMISKRYAAQKAMLSKTK
ncbi:MAG: citrate lyase beta subunit [Alphaproteobacteria bacterium]|nr:citrate lyase beta subunit [Alphaproteobacteria bacterium]